MTKFLLVVCLILPLTTALPIKVIRNETHIFSHGNHHSLPLQPRDINLPRIEYGPNHSFDLFSERSSSSQRTLLSLDPISYQPIRIMFDTSSVENSQSDTRQTKLDALLEQILPSVQTTLEAALSVQPVSGKLTLTPPATRNSYSPNRQCPETHQQDRIPADLLIHLAIDSPECQETTNANGYPCELDQFDRPIGGSLNVCLESMTLNRLGKISSNQLSKTTRSVLRVMCYILGINSELFVYYRNPLTGYPLTPRPLATTTMECVGGEVVTLYKPGCNTIRQVDSFRNGGTSQYELVTPTALIVARNHFNCQELSGVRLENQKGMNNGCFGSFLDDRYYRTELVSSDDTSPTYVLSPLTLAILEDTGWYRANYTSTTLSSFGRSAGCSFLDSKCITSTKNDRDNFEHNGNESNDGNESKSSIPPYSKGYFCNQTLKYSSVGTLLGSYVCDSGHNVRGLCDLVDYNTTYFGEFSHGGPNTLDMQYFSNPNLGAFSYKTNYCPVTIDINSYHCEDTSGSPVIQEEGEYYGPNSKCYNRPGVEASLCFQSNCNFDTLSLEVTVLGGMTTNATKYICDVDFRVFTLPNGSEFECPRLSAVCPAFYCPDNCSGRGVCNNHHVTHVHSNTTNNAPLMFLRPTCECFDTSDSSPGCTHTSIIRAPLMDVESCGDVVIHDSNDLDYSNNSKSNDSSGFSRAGGGPWAKRGANYSKAWKVYRWIFGVCILPLYHDIFLS